MEKRPEVRSQQRRFAIGAGHWVRAALLLLLGACSPPLMDAPASPGPVGAPLTEELRQILQRLGADRFRVEDLQVGQESVRGWLEADRLRDSHTYDRRLLFSVLPFSARVVFLLPMQTPVSTVADEGEALLDFPSALDRSLVLALFGYSQRWEAGDRAEVRSNAVFDLRQPGWSFRAFDPQLPEALRPLDGSGGN